MALPAVLNSRLIFVTLVIIALYACTLPWVSNPGAALSLSAYDLAEWTSLVPTIRAGSPPLLPTLLLRLPLLWLAWLVALQPGQRWGRGLAVLIAAVALLPPLQFVKTPDDINYRQQFILAGLTLVVGLLGVSDRWVRWHGVLALAIAVVGAIGALVGTTQGYTLMRDYQLPVQIGLGGIVFTMSLVLIGLQQTRQLTARS